METDTLPTSDATASNLFHTKEEEKKDTEWNASDHELYSVSPALDNDLSSHHRYTVYPGKKKSRRNGYSHPETNVVRGNTAAETSEEEGHKNTEPT